MTSLTDRAEAAMNGEGDTRNTRPRGDGSGNQMRPVQPSALDMSDYEVGEGDPEMVPVHIAWLRVRKEVGAIAKREKYEEGRTKYNFRGVDTTVNTFSPITLKYGVNIFPVKVNSEYEEIFSKSGTRGRGCSVTVTWQVMGPMGDVLPFELQSCGEAMDYSDKGTAKAQSVALRVLLLNSGLIPTNDKDPDAEHIERGEPPVRQPSTYVDEITNPKTSSGRLLQIHAELKQARQLDALVHNEHGDEEKIGPMIVRIGTERKAAEEAGLT